jgi:hypothetical protein
MSNFRAVWWCAIIVLSMGISAQHAVAQFGGGGNAATDAVRKEIEAYEAAAPRTASAKAPAISCKCAGESESLSVARIEQALRRPLKPTGLDFTEQPLEDVVTFLQDEYEIPIQVDLRALNDAGLTLDEKVTVSLQHVSLQAALRIMLRQLHLTSFIRDEVLLISTPEAAEEELITCVYDVRDLAGDGRSFRALADAITACVAQGSWAKNGGGVAEIRPVQPGLLVIAQTRGLHEEIHDLLAAIRKVRQSGNPAQEDGQQVEGFGVFGGAMGGEGELTPADPFAE